MSLRIIKEFRDIFDFLAKNFQWMLRKRFFPRWTKRCRIVPVYNKKNNNYRPVKSLSNCQKSYGRYMQQIMNILYHFYQSLNVSFRDRSFCCGSHWPLKSFWLYTSRSTNSEIKCFWFRWKIGVLYFYLLQ